MPKILIKHEDRYFAFIREQGVGDNDQVASSPKSYVTYLLFVACPSGSAYRYRQSCCIARTMWNSSPASYRVAPLKRQSRIGSLRCGSTSLWSAMTSFSQSLLAEPCVPT